MSIFTRTSVSDLRGVVRLAMDATLGVTDVVEKMHHTVQLRQAPLGESRAGRTGGLTGFVYAGIRATTRVIGRGVDAGLTPLAALLPTAGSSSRRDKLIAAINGVYGDHLAETGNPLAAKMTFVYRGTVLDTGQLKELAGRNVKLLLWVHGLCLNETHWTRNGVNHGDTLSRDLGYTPLYLRYNSGLPIAANGRELADMLERLLKELPGSVDELVIAGHSMGGLVARSACHYGRLAAHGWPRHLRKLVFIGTPHHGAPLERGGSWFDYALDLSPYTAPFARIGKKRSAGITSLRHGSISDEAQGRVPLPDGVDCFALAATLAKKPGRLHERLIGDGLVPVDSALGRSRDPLRDLGLPEDRRWIAYATSHTELLGRPEVYAQLRGWLVQKR